MRAPTQIPCKEFAKAFGKSLGLSLGLAAGLAAAQEVTPPPELPELQACLEGCDTMGCDAACRGRVTAACTDRLEGDLRDTTTGMVLCQQAEFAAWASVLDALWPEAQAAAEDMGLGPTLAEAQQAWRDWRAAECRYATALWGEGTHRQVAWPACRADLTADRVVDLRARLRAPR